MYATLDVAILDLYKGNLEFIKNGACPTFIKRGKEIQENFFKDLFANVDDESVKILYKVIENIQRNLDNIMKEGK